MPSGDPGAYVIQKEAQNAQHIQDALFSISDWRDAIYARIVTKLDL